MMKKLYFFSLCLLWINLSFAQVLRSDPPFPNAEESITIIFNAEFGNQGLKDCNCDVYLHTGAITENSTSPSDWKYVQGDWGKEVDRLKMRRAAPNVYTFTYTPRDFHSIPNGEEVQQLAFVFRNGDGSKVGRATDGSDIYLDLFVSGSQLQTLLEQPVSNIFVNTPNQEIQIVAQSSQPAIFRVYDNNTLVHTTADSSSKLDYRLISDNTGLTHEVDVVIAASNEADTLQFKYFNLGDTPVGDPAAVTEPGMTKLDDNTYRLMLIAPGKSSVFVLNENNNWEIDENDIMTRSTNGEYFWKDISVSDPAGWYTYQYLIDGDIKIADPYATIVLDPSNDRFINNNYFPGFPTGASGLVTAYKFEGHNFTWTDQNFDQPEKTDLNIYELLMRDFLASHSYEDLRDTLPYLKRLGINAVQLMPVQEFEGNDSWGYNPSFHMALDKYYGDPVQFKAFVNRAHELGMAVIVDVVYNHAFSQSPLAQLYWDKVNFKPADDNPFLNVDARHPFNVGYDFDHESQFTKDFVKTVSDYWLEEYHIDGFRYDLSKGFTQRNNPNDVGAWSSYDDSRISILKDYADAVWDTDDEAILILEHFADNNEEKELSNYGFMLWGNINEHYSEAAMGYHDNGKSNLSSAIYTARGWDQPHLVSYMESHDEERLMYKNLEFGNSNGSYSVKDLNTALERQKMANLFYWLIPGPKMIWQFGELGFEFSINRCENGTIDPNCRLSKKPIRWDYTTVSERRQLYNHIAELTYLRSTYELEVPSNLKYLLGGEVKIIEVKKDDITFYAIANFGVTTNRGSLDLSENGTWYELYSGNTVDYTGSVIDINLAPGEYRLYANQNINLQTTTRELIADHKIALYPNPANEFVFVTAENEMMIEKINFINVNGQRVSTSIYANSEISIDHLPAGVYFVEIITDQGLGVKKLIKK